MGLTWKCEPCGAVLANEDEFRKHVCQGKSMRTCPRCMGARKIVQAFGPPTYCPVCKGKGKVDP